MKEIIQNHIEKNIETAQLLIQDTSDIEKSAKVAIEALRNGNKILIAGNGGAAANANNFVGDLVGRFRKQRKAMSALALNNNPSVMTAVGNDYGFDYVFSRQIEATAKPGDVFFVISTSGNSKNLLEAIKVAKDFGCKVIGLTGKTGGKMAQECDLLIKIPSEDTQRIEELHMLVAHALCDLIEGTLFPQV